jgi:hypothetical protein
MKRAWIPFLTLAASYLLMRKWPAHWPVAAAALSASMMILLGWSLATGSLKRGTGLLARGLTCAASLACGSLLALFLLHAPPALEEASEQVMAVFLPGPQQQKKLIEQHINQSKPRSGNWLWNEHTIRPLPRRANLKPGNQPEVFLQLDEPALASRLIQRRAYISYFALGTYQDAAWSLTPPDTANPPAFPDRSGTMFSYEIFHPSDPNGKTPIITVQGMRDADIAPLSYRGDGILILPPSEKAIGYRYRARSVPLSIDDLTDAATAAPRTAVPAAWLELPDNETLVMGLRGLNAEMLSAGSLKQQLMQLREGMRRECEYSLDIANAGNRDPLENFLFHEKRGHCELFATAGALAARAMGVPARVAYGWAGGSYYETSNLFVFRAREAHAWTEVLISGVGWVVMDCTPAASIGQSRTAPPEEKPLAEDDVAAMPEDDVSGSHQGWVSLLLIGICAVAAVMSMLLRILTKRQPAGNAEEHAAAAAAGEYYRSFLQLCRQRGILIAPHLTLRKLLEKISPRPPFAAPLERYHYQTRYGAAAADLEQEARLDAAIQEEKRRDP